MIGGKFDNCGIFLIYRFLGISRDEAIMECHKYSGFYFFRYLSYGRSAQISEAWDESKMFSMVYFTTGARYDGHLFYEVLQSFSQF